jgi:uncharacterized BrkB/YihY/UPF0761 family membrane protein
VTATVPIRRRAAWDIALSIVFLVLAVITALVGAIGQLFVLAFTDYCPGTCNIDEAVGAVFVVWAIIGFVVLASTIITIVLLVRRRRAWWVALIGLVVAGGGAIVGYVLYVAVVGAGS